MQSANLESIIMTSLDNFYRRRLQKLSELKLEDTLKKKNPYMFRAIGMKTAHDIVERLLQAFMSSSEETIFGDAFFEPVVKAVCQGVAADGAGMDVLVENDDMYTVISVKSGPNWGNSSQVEKIGDHFRAARHRFDNKKLKKQFRALLGHCYGRKRSEATGNRVYATRSGQAFWEEITEDPEFYLKLMRLMGERPFEQRAVYEEEWASALNRFEFEFLSKFSFPNGRIDWEKLVKFNSGSNS